MTRPRRESPWPTSPGDTLNAQLIRCLVGGGLLGAGTALSYVETIDELPAALAALAPIAFVIGLVCGAILTPLLYLAGRRRSFVLSIAAPTLASVALLYWLTRGVLTVPPLIVVVAGSTVLGPWAAGLLRVRARPTRGLP